LRALLHAAGGSLTRAKALISALDHAGLRCGTTPGTGPAAAMDELVRAVRLLRLERRAVAQRGLDAPADDDRATDDASASATLAVPSTSGAGTRGLRSHSSASGPKSILKHANQSSARKKRVQIGGDDGGNNPASASASIRR
jgi:hypothetical protein